MSDGTNQQNDVQPSGNSNSAGSPTQGIVGSVLNAWSNVSKSAKVAAAGAAITAVGVVAPHLDSGSLDSINSCGLEGNAKSGTWQARANPLKNRWTLPSGESLNSAVNFDALLNAPSDPNAKDLPIGKFAQYQTGGQVLFDESQSGEIQGYIAEVKTGGNESCNCNTSDEQYMDTHIYIAGQSGVTDKSKCIIVEVTPRLRAMKLQQGVDWSTATLISTLTPGTHVQISGWLFDDQEHKPNSAIDPGHGSNVWRGSCWEIHPVTDIQVIP